jgi:hypothetical protein
MAGLLLEEAGLHLKVSWANSTEKLASILKVHKIEIFFGFDFEICNISLLVMSKY